jgi:hypothetical protein
VRRVFRRGGVRKTMVLAHGIEHLNLGIKGD